MTAAEQPAATKATSPSLHSASTDDSKSWASTAAEEASIETAATTPPMKDDAPRRRTRSYTVTQKDVDEPAPAAHDDVDSGKEDIDWGNFIVRMEAAQAS